MEDKVEEQLEQLLGRMETRIRGHLQSCSGTAERLLMIELIRYSLRLVPLTMSDRRTEAVKILPDGLELHMETLPQWNEDNGNTYSPQGLAWLPDMAASRIFLERGSISCRLVPQLRVPDPMGDQDWSIDIALYWPMPQGRGLQKIAIECDEFDWRDKTTEQVEADKHKERFLQKRGWTVVRYISEEISRDARNVVREIIDLASTRSMQISADSHTGTPEGTERH